MLQYIWLTVDKKSTSLDIIGKIDTFFSKMRNRNVIQIFSRFSVLQKNHDIIFKEQTVRLSWSSGLSQSDMSIAIKKR